jgi:elongation factor Ts
LELECGITTIVYYYDCVFGRNRKKKKKRQCINVAEDRSHTFFLLLIFFVSIASHNRDTQEEREAAEAIQGAANKIAKVAANKAAAEAFSALQATRKANRASHKERAEASTAARKAGSAAAAPAPVEAAAPAAEAAPAEAAPAAASTGGGEVTPKTIKALRDLTGAGMMDCKKALTEADGDQEVAAEFLRKKGLAQADKKASRVAAEGKIAVSAGSDGKAVMVEVNCETDFVGKDSTFLGYCAKVATAAATMGGSENVEELMTQEVDGTSIEASRQALVSKIGENIQVRRMKSLGNGSTTVGGYVHMGSIGVLVEIEGGDEQLCKDIAMHVAAMNPPFATADDVPQEVLDNEKRILTEQALDSGKPEAIVEKMVEGRIRKYLEEKCLVSQNYVKNGDITVQQLLDQNDAKMIGFSRLVVGEGIEKKVDDFAAEVASMAGGN